MDPKFRTLFILNFFLTTASFASTPVALVYNGKGTCQKACAIAMAIAVKEAGLSPRFVSESEITEQSNPEEISALFKDAKVWIQPGGYAKESFLAMSGPLKQGIREFTASGGGYVGICAGAFMATEEIGTTGLSGLGLIPGRCATYFAHPAKPGLNYSMENVRWQGEERQLYFEGGPFFYDLNPQVEVVATYADGTSPAAVRGEYGLGRVFLSGPHPEAPEAWRTQDEVEDSDGLDLQIAVDMIKWAARKKL